MRVPTVIGLLSTVFSAYAAIDLGWRDDTDLTSFITRPELRAPYFAVSLYKPELVTPGYWFVAPYTEINQKGASHKYYQPCQIGPHIFDNYGTLVWSGACHVRNQNTCDFRATRINGSDYLSAILYRSTTDPIGRAFVMNSSYQVIDEIFVPPEQNGMNMHEFELVDNAENGTSALHIVARTEVVDTAEIPGQEPGIGWIYNMGIREVDLRTKETLFQWWAYPEVALNESNFAVERELKGPQPYGWNWFHANAIVKNRAGDYLLSSRYTDTIFKVGKEGKIAWRLGGRRSDFELRGFNFSRQHDPQWIDSNATHEVITFLDNGSDGITHTSEVSTAYKVVLDLVNMTAEVLQEWVRPDGRRSNLRGNFQTLPSGNVFAAWSDNSVISEHTNDGELVMAAEFMSNRTVTYRAYKFNFTGNPAEPPVIKAFAYGEDEASSTTVMYMSWNGATEVEGWNLYGGMQANASEGEAGQLVGSVWKTGFETRFQLRGYERYVYAEAVDVEGKVLGKTRIFEVEPPPEWEWEWEVFDSTQSATTVQSQNAEGSQLYIPKTEL